MRNILTLLFVLLLSSCGTTYQLSTLNHDPIYDNNGNVVDVTVIDNEFELARKFRTDDTFRWNFAQFAMRQDMRWNYDFYWNNRMYRSPYASPFDFYWDSHNYWWNWASNSPFNMGFNHWDPFGFNNNYGMGWSYSWNNRRWSSNQWGNPYGWNNYYGWNNGFYNRYRGTNVAYHTGRRSSTMSVRDRRGNAAMIESTKVKRRIINNPDVVIDREVIKLKRNNPNIRVYENPNNVPNNVIIRNNNNKPVRNYNRPENNTRNSNNNIRNNNSRPPRTSTPPRSSSPRPVISRPTTRSSSPPVAKRGNINQ